MNRLVKSGLLIMIIVLFSTIVSFADSGSIMIRLDGADIVSDSPPVIVNGRTLVPARAVFEAMGGTVNWSEASREVSVTVNNVNVKLKIDSKKAYIDGTEKTLDVPARIIKNRTMIPVRFVSESLGCQVSWDDKNRIVSIVSPAGETEITDITDFSSGTVSRSDSMTTAYMTFEQSDPEIPGGEKVAEGAQQKLVVIDPGHGGADTGSRGFENGVAVLNEKDVNLDVALRLQKILEDAGARIYMIRTEDGTIPLYDRQDTANNLGASLYVAIHNNSYTNSTPSGTEVHYHGKDDPPMDGISSMALAQSLQSTLASNLGLPNRGAKVSPELAVLRRTIMPAVIIEGAFLSNPNDLDYMKTDDFREKYAMSAARCIIEALNVSIE